MVHLQGVPWALALPWLRAGPVEVTKQTSLRAGNSTQETEEEEENKDTEEELEEATEEVQRKKNQTHSEM